MYCALLALAPQWKAKSQLYLRGASHRYDDTLKIENLRQYRSSLKQKSSFFVCKRTGFVNQMLGKFVKVTLTRVMSHCLRLESSHSVKNVTRVESPSFLNVTRVESLTGITLSLQFAGTDHTTSSHAFLNPTVAVSSNCLLPSLFEKKHVRVHRESLQKDRD